MATETPETLSLARYVPRVSAEWGLRTSELFREIDGTLCYIDISGFTALSEKLARRGRIGAEELTEVLNYVFGKMLAVAYDRGGSLLKFGGDALLLIFTGSGHPAQAASAAVEMQAVLREARSYETSAGRLSLKMSVGLHSGTVHLFRVGDSHQELILTGPAASMTTEMEETAEAGEVLISRATRDAISGTKLKAKEHGYLLNWRKARLECCGWSPRIPLDPEAIAEGMPVALREFLSHGAAEPEHHIATVGFIRYKGVDALMEQGGPAAVAAALDELVRNVQQAVDAEGVTFLASDIDEDGGKIIIVAGVPAVQEDDEGRVLRAARTIVDNAGTLPLRIGVNQGHVFVGEIGTDFRATYTIMGDTVNLAARLMAAASPGEIYASPSALDNSSTLFETTPLEPFYVKGKEHPVQAYAVGEETGRRQADRSGSLPFTGRADELARMHDVIHDLFQGTGHAVAIVGERGVGKSRFVDEILPALDRAEHIDIRAEPYGIGTPYRPLRDPVRRLLGVKRGSPPAMARALRRAMERLAPEHVALAPLVADVAMVDLASTPEADLIDPQFRQDRAADLLIELFAEVYGDRPLFFEVEDGHYMDEASVHIMDRIAAATAEHDWLVLTTRRRAVDGFDPGLEEIALGPLTDDEARSMVVAATEAAPLRPHDVEAIVQRAGGLPLFLEEIIGAVRKAGGVQSLPDSLDAVVSSQIDALPPLARRLLRFSSVLGQSFRISILNQLMEEEGIRLDAATRRELAGFLDQDGPDRLRFRHAMIRDVAYRALSFKRRRQLHIHAGEIAEEAAGAHPESAADVLALHFSLGQDHDRAWRYSRIAGDQARDAYANVDAAAHYQRALDSARRLRDVPNADRVEVLTSLGDVSARAGLFEEALDAYRRATRLVAEDPDERIGLLLKRAVVRRRTSAYGAALRETSQGLRLVASGNGAGSIRARARLNAERGAIRRWQQRPADALRLAEQAEADARASGDDETLARSLDLIDWAYRMMGQTDRAVHYPEALAIFERLGDLTGVAQVWNNLGADAFWEGRWDDAIDAYEKSRDAEHRTGNDVQAAISAANIAELLINQGRIEEAEPLLVEAIRVLKASGHAPAATFAESELARLLIRKGEFEPAENLLDEISERGRTTGEAMYVVNAAIQTADSKLRQGAVEEGLVLIARAEEQAGEMAELFGPTIARLTVIGMAELGKYEEALVQVDQGLAQARQQGLQFDEALLLDVKHGVIVRSGGEPDPDEVETVNRLFDGLDIRREPVLTV